ncbi:G-type lectin S-receptor-like serine/threonine-protein kinase SD1-13 [Cornus florida]|uniref:G-type lectin S-receptor-like serine/threonine-protein kinase SD1-13 n=1 Tax=Cornus florida TaxID=4283 RepID=UPI0028976DA1|nr:G-type lectin S-receptor-like serine/threonine-protein kinase SD1-13 [Cornus florida]
MTLLQNLVLMFYFFQLEFSTATDTITPIQRINDPESIVSNGATFKLGFFSPFNATKRYVAIWYNNVPVTAVVQVANRDKPLNDSSGTLTISEDGNLVVMDGQKQIVWSSNVPNSSAHSSAQLLDSGKLVLQDNIGGSITWESFEHPSDSMLQKMKISTNKYTGERTVLTSWKSSLDPSTGSFIYGLNPLNIPELYV